MHSAGVYLIGRVVTFEDPITSARHPELAVRTSDGALWHTSGGLGWLNPYSKAAWNYDVDVAVAAAKAGFDEIQFDYVRFPSDGDVSIIRYPGAHTQPMGETIAAFLRYAKSRLHPLGVRVSADVFGLSATHDLGIGQYAGPDRRGRRRDLPDDVPVALRRRRVQPPDPNAAPGKTVAYSLRDFRAKLAGSTAQLVPWLQDFSLGRTYTAADVAAQMQAARQYDTGGFMLWNAAGIYTPKALAAGPPPPLPRLSRRTLGRAAVCRLFVHAVVRYREPHGRDPRDRPPHRDSRPALARDRRAQGAVGRLARCRSTCRSSPPRRSGATITDVDGNTFIDFTGGVGCLNVGHAHPQVVEAVQEQLARFLHTDFTIVPYEVYVDARRAAARARAVRAARRRRRSSTPAPRRSRTRSSSRAPTPAGPR